MPKINERVRSMVSASIIAIMIIFAYKYFFEGKGKINNEANSEVTQTQELKYDLDRKDIVFSTNTQRLPINTNNIKGSLSLKGARIDDITLKNYRETIEKNSSLVNLLSPNGSKDSYFANFGWLSLDHNLVVPNGTTVWKTDDTMLTVGKPTTLYWENEQGVRFEIVINLDKNYMFDITQRVINNTDNSYEFAPFAVINRLNEEAKSSAVIHEGPLAVLDGSLEEEKFSDVKDKGKISYTNIKEGWLGITDKYWLTAIIPDKSINFNANFSYSKKADKDFYQIDYLGQKFSLASNKSIENKVKFFAGPKILEILDYYEDNLNISSFDRAVDFGWLYIFTKPLLIAMNYIYKLVGNFGISIITLTVIIKLLFYGLSKKSYISILKMKKLQPKLEELKKKYGDDRMRFNYEMMQLYKSKKVNPLSGCWPTLVQIPVFFALYKVLFVSIEMRHAPFFGWIRDLSSADPTSIFNLFGILKWHLPSFLQIGILPVFMGATMYIQQLLNPAPNDPVQAKVSKFMPLIFVIMFSSFPAGLVLYWAVNNLLSILQQVYINFKYKDYY